MSNFDQSALGLHLHKLMQSKLGPHLDWKMPDIRDIVGPYDPSAFRRYDERRVRIVNECRNKLAQYSDDQIQILIDPKRDDADEIRNKWSGFLHHVINNLEKRKPAWFAGGFGHPAYQADFEYWGQVPHFTNHEALFLTLGVEPDHFTEDQVSQMSTSLGKGSDLWETLKYMLRRRDQIERQFPIYAHRNEIDPKELFEWIDLVKLDIHPEFTSRYLVDRTIAGPSEENETARSPIPKEIGELAASMGFESSDDTIRKYLKRGATFISSDWKPK